MTERLTAEEEAAIRARLQNATPGPWYACHDGECPCGFVWSIPEDLIVSMPAHEGDTTLTVEPIKRNAKFIAAARTDIPALLAEVDYLRSEMAAVRDVLLSGNQYRASLRVRAWQLDG